MSIYADLILDHYHHPRNNKSISHASAQVDVNNPLCGDALHMEVVEKDGIIKEVGFTGEGCAISIASASLLTEHVKGKKTTELVAITPDDVIGLLGIELTPNRMKCALLAWEGIRKLVKH